MSEEVEAFGLPWPESQRREAAAAPTEKNPPLYRSLLTRAITPVFGRALWNRETKTASLGAAQISLALVAHRFVNGSYPESLDELQAAGWILPKDPFGGTPYRYRREGDGFVVYSVSSDMTDDGGLDPYWRLTGTVSAEETEQRRKHYDLPFRRPL